MQGTTNQILDHIKVIYSPTNTQVSVLIIIIFTFTFK